MTDGMSIKVRNLPEIKALLDKMPLSARRMATEEAGKYLMGNERRGLQYYPPRKSKYKRTYNLRFGWQAQDWGDGVNIRIVNDVPYAPYVQGDNDQAWMHKGVWRTVQVVLDDNVDGIVQSIYLAWDRWIKQNEVK